MAVTSQRIGDRDMSQTLAPSQPDVVRRSRYVQVRALLVTACIAIIGLAGAAAAGATVPPGPGGNGTPSICVQVPAANVTTPAGGPGYGFVGGPPASDQAYDHVSCPPPGS